MHQHVSLIVMVLVFTLHLTACNNPTVTVVQDSTVVAAAEPGASSSTPSPAVATPLTLFSFGEADDTRWRVVNDGVMGGRSQGFVQGTEGALVFTGELVTDGGGFTSVRAVRDFDLSGYTGIELRVRGEGRSYALSVNDATRSRGRQVNRLATFPTNDTWTVVRIPFATLRSSAHGRAVRVAPLDLSAVRSTGVYIMDGIDGPFRLEVDWIRAYRSET